jgi:hypothetical protein
MTGVFDDLAERSAVVKAWTFSAVSPSGSGEALD